MKTILSALLLLSLVSCHSFDDYVYETVALELSNADNSGILPIDAGESAPRLAYAIKMSFTMRITENKDTDRYESNFRNEDQVTSFVVNSPDTFNLLPPNTSLNHFFNYSTGGGTGSPLESWNYGFFASGGTYVEEKTPAEWTKEHYLLLMNPPDTVGPYTFIVNVGFSDGRQLTDTIHAILN